MAALTQVKLETVTSEQFDEMVRAWDTWTRIRNDIQTFLAMKARAEGTWTNDVGDFLGSVYIKGLDIASIQGHDDGEWETNTVRISVDDLFDMQRLFEQYSAIVAMRDELVAAQREERSKEARLAQYEKLKKEFEEEGGPM